jgi:hypothetical protein
VSSDGNLGAAANPRNLRCLRLNGLAGLYSPLDSGVSIVRHVRMGLSRAVAALEGKEIIAQAITTVNRKSPHLVRAFLSDEIVRRNVQVRFQCINVFNVVTIWKSAADAPSRVLAIVMKCNVVSSA